MTASTALHPPHKTSRSPEPTQKVRWFRLFLLTLLTGLGLVAGLVWGAIFFIQTDPAQALIQKQVNRVIPGNLSWEKLKLAIWDGRVQISGIKLTEASGRELARVALLAVDLNWSALAERRFELTRIQIDSPALDVTLSEKGAVDIVSALVSESEAPAETPPSDSGSSSFDLRVELFQVNNARIKVASPEFKTDLADLSVEVAGFHLAELCASVKLALSGGHLVSGETDLNVQSLNTSARIDKETISDIDIHAQMPGLSFAATGRVNGLSGSAGPEGPALDITALLDIDTGTAVRAFGLSPDQYQGSGRVHLAVKGGIDNPNADIRLEFGRGIINGQAVSAIQAAVSLADRRITLEPCRIDLPAGSVPMGGRVDLSKAFPTGFTHPMTDLNTIGYNFYIRPDNLSLSALVTGENIPEGILDARIQVQGQGVTPGQIAAKADLDVAVRDLVLPQLSGPAQVQFKTGVELEKERLTLTDFTLEGPGMTGTGTGGLDMPGFDPKAMTMTGQLDLSVADLSVPSGLVGQKALGSVEIHADVQGAVTAPDMNLSIAAQNLSAKGFLVDDLSCKARIDQRLVEVESLSLKRNQGVLNAGGTLDLGPDQALDLSLDFNELDLSDLAPDLGAKGKFTGRITGGGTLKQPKVALSFSGQNPGYQNYVLGSIQAQLTFADNILTFKQARVQHNKAHMDIAGQINVGKDTLDLRVKIPETDLKGVDPAADETLASGRLGLELMATGQLHAPDISGHINAVDLSLPDAPDMTADAGAVFEIHGPLDTPSALEASVDISRFALSNQDQDLIFMENARARLHQGQFELPSVPVKIMNQGELTLSAAGDIKGDLNAQIGGSIPVAMFVPLADGINSADGQILISLTAKGQATAPDLRGSVEFSSVDLDLEALEEPLQKICGRIVLTPESIEIQNVRAGLGDGQLTLTGRTGLINGKPDKFTLDLNASQVPVDIPDTLTMTLNSKMTWAGTMEKSTLIGGIDIFEGTYYKDVDLSLMSLAMDQTKKSRPKTREPGPEFLKTIDLNIYVTRREAISVDNNLANMSISPNLTVRGTAYAPALDGRAAVDEGTIIFQKAEFDITEGAIDFINPYKIEPEITLTSETTISSYTITLSITGTPDNLDFEFTSDPDATDSDIISLIIFGKTTEEMGSGSDSDGDSSSAAAIAKVLADPLSEKLRETTGLSEVSISVDEDDNGDTGVHVSLGADLSRQLSVSYGMDISDGETVQTVTTYYKLLEHLLLSSFQDTSGKYGGELKYRLEFR